MQKGRELTDAELDALDPAAPDPRYKPRHQRHSVDIEEKLVRDEVSLRSACRNETFWLHAAAFGCGPVGAAGRFWVSYLDAIDWLSRRAERKDGRYRYGPKARNIADENY